jgi:hypothetical protein
MSIENDRKEHRRSSYLAHRMVTGEPFAEKQPIHFHFFSKEIHESRGIRDKIFGKHLRAVSRNRRN